MENEPEQAGCFSLWCREKERLRTLTCFPAAPGCPGPDRLGREDSEAVRGQWEALPTAPGPFLRKWSLLLHSILPSPPQHHVPDTLYSSPLAPTSHVGWQSGPSGGWTSWGEEMLRGQQANSQARAGARPCA